MEYIKIEFTDFELSFFYSIIIVNQGIICMALSKRTEVIACGIETYNIVLSKLRGNNQKLIKTDKRVDLYGVTWYSILIENI